MSETAVLETLNVRTNMKKSRHYLTSATTLKKELAAAVPREQLMQFHRKNAWLHFLVLARQYALIALGSWVSVTRDEWYFWVPAAIVVGFTIFNFTVLLHEVVHKAVFEKGRPRWERFLGLLYAFPSGISASQFTRWHLDHHDNLGSSTDDPKRFHLSPKKNARWFKALYLTPALFPIYFRAAKAEVKTYDKELANTIAWERRFTILFHLSLLATLWITLGPWLAFKLYMVPVFFVFPVAFVLNRLGQHYNVDPDDPAKWSTLVASSWFWNFAFLWSNFHLEHHYYPNVPFYRLEPLHQALLKDFYRKRDMKPVGYAELLWNWFGKNKQPHTKWGCKGS
ncbi:MAG: fatty acid desaturase [Planctomycetes bacterium]|nr:fatty acid desaturase [Planctomycetota bacterium]